MKWVQMHQMILAAKPDFSLLYVPQNSIRFWFYQMVTSNKFEVVIGVVIILNIFSMVNIDI